VANGDPMGLSKAAHVPSTNTCGGENDINNRPPDEFRVRYLPASEYGLSYPESNQALQNSQTATSSGRCGSGPVVLISTPPVRGAVGGPPPICIYTLNYYSNVIAIATGSSDRAVPSVGSTEAYDWSAEIPWVSVGPPVVAPFTCTTLNGAAGGDTDSHADAVEIVRMKLGLP